MNWDGLPVVVTGASRGIGRCIVEQLAARGATLGCIARSEGDLASLRKELDWVHIETVTADVSDRGQLEAAILALEAANGPAEVLINNAGIGLYGPVARLDPDRAEMVMKVNYLGTVYAITAVLPGMLARRRGHIVNVASIAGRLGPPFEAAYGASKFAVVGFSEALAAEVARFGVRVSVINPGPVATGFFDARGHAYQRAKPRPVSPEKVAREVIAAVERRRFERAVPRALGVAFLVRHLLPWLYEAGTQRAFRKELDLLAGELAGELEAR